MRSSSTTDDSTATEVEVKPKNLYYLVDFNTMMLISMTREQLEDHYHGLLLFAAGVLAIAGVAGLVLLLLQARWA